MFDNAPLAASDNARPIRSFGRNDEAAVTDFVAGLDEQALASRFHRHMTTDLVRAHYQALDWDNAVLLAWTVDGAIHGLCEVMLYRTDARLEAEIAISVDAEWRCAGVEPVLLAQAAGEAERLGATRSLIHLRRDDYALARLVRALGGTIFWDMELAVLTH